MKDPELAVWRGRLRARSVRSPSKLAPPEPNARRAALHGPRDARHRRPPHHVTVQWRPPVNHVTGHVIAARTVIQERPGAVLAGLELELRRRLVLVDGCDHGGVFSGLSDTQRRQSEAENALRITRTDVDTGWETSVTGYRTPNAKSRGGLLREDGFMKAKLSRVRHSGTRLTASRPWNI